MKYITLNPKFVDKIPEIIENGNIYISIPFNIAIHKCCCGCGNEVVTPINPTDWTLIYDGSSISLDPSIGNWSFNCQSHYWIRNNKIIWSKKWSRKEIDKNRKYDEVMKKDYFKNKNNFIKKIKKWWAQ